MNCDACHRPLPLMRTENPEMPLQAVFTLKDGQRVHVPPCPAKPNPINQVDED